MFEVVGPHMENELSNCWNDAISSAQSFLYDPVKDPRVMLFDKKDLSIGCGAGSFGEGDFYTYNLREFGIYTGGSNDGVSSVWIPKDLRLTIYDKDNLGGASEILDGPLAIYDFATY
jgi:hypothetical protein